MKFSVIILSMFLFIVLLSGFASATFGNSLDTNLTHYFTMDDTNWPYINDSIGSDYGQVVLYTIYNNTGAPLVSINFSNEGLLNKSIYWNTTEENPIINMSFLVLNLNQTISMWVNPDNNNTAYGLLMSFHETTINERIYTNSTGHLIWMQYGSGDKLTNANIKLNQNIWNHIIVIRGSEGMKLYLNNVLVGTNIYTGSSSGSPTSLLLGGTFQNMFSPKGFMDEVGFWNRNLNSTEISDLWNNGNGCGYTSCVITESTPPTYSSAANNNTIKNVLTKFSILVDDDTALHPNGGYIFSTNNTGSWINETFSLFSTTPSWANVTKTLNSTSGTFIGYRWFFNDTVNNKNSTPIYTLTTTTAPDTTAPTYSGVTINNTIAGLFTAFTFTANDNIALNPNGNYTLRTNNTGVWTNSSTGFFTTTPDTKSIGTVLNSTVGTFIGYLWYIMDNVGNTAETIAYTLTTTATAITISDCDELQNMNSDLTRNYTLSNNIDCFATISWNNFAGFIPIGNNTVNFSGTFNGNGYTISNLYINNDTLSNAALFGYTTAEVNISNINLNKIEIVGKNEVAGLVGINYGTIKNSSIVTGNISGETFNVGGLVGKNYGTINASYSNINVSSRLAGVNSVGGLVGYNQGTIINTYALGNVTGNSFIGGLVGDSGGGTISNSYSMGAVVGNSNLGGLIADDLGTTTNSYWDNQTSGQASSDGGTGKTTAQMKTLATYSGWNIAVTQIDNNNGYPYLGINGTTWLMIISDLTPPSYSNILVSSLKAGESSKFSINVNDNFKLQSNGTYIFSTDNSGSWTNETIVNFTLTPNYVNTTITLNSTVGMIVNYTWYIKDNAGNVNQTLVYNLTTLPESIPPTYNASINNTFSNEVTGFYIVMADNVELGWLVYETNITGSWVNTSPISNLSTYVTTDAVKNTNLTVAVGTYFGYRWYLNDSYGNINNTPIYYITTMNESIMYCQNLEDIQYHLDRNYTLINDINCTETTTWNSGLGFNPIGNNTLGFSYQGTLEGNDYSVVDLYIYQPWYENENGDLHTVGGIGIGLFAQLSGIVQNLSLEDFDITGENQVGTLVGNLTGTIINCTVEGHVYGDTNVGGLVGVNNLGKINDSISYVHLNAKEKCGGLVGWNTGNIYNSSSNNTIHCSGSSDGGEGSLSNEVNGGSAIGGGLVGLNDGNIYNSYSIADVSNTPGWYLNNNMGFTFYNVHQKGFPSYSWQFGSREGDTVGGLIGTNNGIIINSSFSGTTNIQATVTGSIGWNYCHMTVFPKETPTSSQCYGGGYGGSDGSGFVGINEGTINTSYSTSGRFIGTNTANGKLNDVYSNSSSSFIGTNRGKVNNAYTLGTALIDSSLGIYIEVSNSFYKGTIGTNSEYGFAKTETQLKDIKTYTAEGWSTNCPGVFRRILWWLIEGVFSMDLRPSCALTLTDSWDFLPNSTTLVNYFNDNGNGSIWNMDDITPSALNNRYPIFTWQNNTNMINDTGLLPDSSFVTIPANSWINYTQPLLTGNFELSESTDAIFLNTTFDGSLISTNYSFNLTETSVTIFQIVNITRLKVGNYIINITINNSQGNESTILYNITVNKSSPTLGMAWTGTSSIIYGTTSNFVMTITDWLNETADDCIWYRNLPNGIYPIGTWTFNMSTLGCTNYTAGYVLKNLTVLPSGCSGCGGGDDDDFPTNDTTSPTYYSNSINNTANGTIIKFSIIINDDRALHSTGTYIFSTNNSGSWINNTYGTFISTPQTISANKILNDTVGYIVGYRWFLTDNVGNGASTSIYTMTVESSNTINNTISSDTIDSLSWLMYGRNLDRANYDKNGFSSIATTPIIRYLEDQASDGSTILVNGFVYISDIGGNLTRWNASNISLGFVQSNYGANGPQKIIVVDGFIYTIDQQSSPAYVFINKVNATTLNYIDEYDVAGISNGGLIMTNNFIYFVASHKILQVNATTMNLYTSYDISTDEFAYSTPAIANGYVYVGSEDGIMYQFDVNNVSNLINTFNTTYRITDSPVVYNNFVYIGNNLGYIYQLNATNISQQMYNYSVGLVGGNSPTIDSNNDYVYIGGNTTFYQLNASNISQEINNYSIAIDDYAVLYGNYIYAFKDNIIYQFNASNITLQTGVYTNALIDQFTSLAIGNGYVYAGAESGSSGGYLIQIPVSSFVQLPLVTILIPGEGINYAVNDSLQLNFSASSSGYGMSMCWYRVTNTTGIIIDNTTIASCANTTFGVPAGNYNYNITLWANNTLGYLNSDTVQFGIITEGPAINLYSPSTWSSSRTNYFNYTATSPVGISMCQLWGNWSGGWHLNYTWTTPTNDTMNFTQLIMADDKPYFYGIWCNNSNGQGTWSNNFTFNIDTVNPLVSIITANNTAFTTESATISFNITEAHIANCTYDLRNSTGNLVSNLSNISISNCSATSYTFAALAGSYTFQLWANDLAGRVNQSMITFTTSVFVGDTGGGGGGVTVIVGNLSWSMSTETGGNRYQLNLLHGSSRSKDLLFENLGAIPLVITLDCEYVSGNLNLCPYISYEYLSFDLPVETNVKIPVQFTVTIPSNFTKGDYIVNLVGIDDMGNMGVLTSEFNIETYGPLTRLATKLTSSRLFGNIKIAYIWIFLLLWLITSIIFSYIYKKNKIQANIGLGVFSGFFISSIVIIFL